MSPSENERPAKAPLFLRSFFENLGSWVWFQGWRFWRFVIAQWSTVRSISSAFILWNVVIVIAGILVKLVAVPNADTLRNKLPSQLGWIADFLPEISTALIVAVVLNLLVEPFNRHQHRKHAADIESKIKEGVLKAVFLRQIPERVFDEVDRELLRANYYRLAPEIALTIRKLESVIVGAPQGFALVTESFHWKIQLSSPEPQPLSIHMSSDACRGMGALSRVLMASINHRELTRKEIDGATSHVGDSIVFSYHDPTLIIKQGDVVDFRIATQFVRWDRDEGNELMLCPASGISVIVNIPNEDFEVEAVAIHPKELTETSVAGELAVKRWCFSHGIFPGQGVGISWRPKSHVPLSSSVLEDLKGKLQTWHERRL
jgi:hypothetical protein